MMPIYEYLLDPSNDFGLDILVYSGDDDSSGQKKKNPRDGGIGNGNDSPEVMQEHCLRVEALLEVAIEGHEQAREMLYEHLSELLSSPTYSRHVDGHGHSFALGTAPAADKDADDAEEMPDDGYCKRLVPMTVDRFAATIREKTFTKNGTPPTSCEVTGRWCWRR